MDLIFSLRHEVTVWSALALLAAACGDDRCIDPLGRVCARSEEMRPLAGAPSAGARGDIDGDGVEEVALLSLAADLLWVVSGAREEVIGGLGAPLALATADLNRDGLDDLIVASSSPAQLVPLRSRGDGTFERGEAWPLDRPAHDLIAVDLDSDGVPELVAADGEALVLVTADGGLRSPVPDVAAIEVEAADLNGDARLDLVSLDLDGTLTSSQGDGMGRFSVTSAVAMGPGVRDLVLSDFDGDSLVDALVRDPLREGFIVAAGDGAGGFAEPRSIAFADDTEAGKGLSIGGYRESSGLASVSMAIGVLHTVFYDASDTAVGHVDARSASVPPFTLLDDGLVASESSFAPLDPQAGPVPIIIDEFAIGVDVKSLAVADFSGDGAPDLAVARSPCNASFFKGDGAGGVSEKLSSGPPFQLCPTTLLTADMNHDGAADLLAQDESGIQIALGDGEGGFTLGAFHSAEYLLLLPILSGAPYSTVVAVTVDGSIVPLASDETGALSPLSPWTPPGDIVSSAAGDLDGDGDDELIVTIGADLLVLRREKDSLALTLEYRLVDLSPRLADSSSALVTVADIDGDGAAEVILDDGEQVVVVQGLDSPVPSIRAAIAMESAPLQAFAGAATDIDGDGAQDYARLGLSGVAYVRGDGFAFSGPSLQSSIGYPHAYADLDGDGRTDLLITRDRYTTVARAEARDIVLPRVGVEHDLLTEWRGPLHRDDGDFNGDGRVDIALGDPHSVTIFWGDGAGFRARSSERRDNGADLSIVRAVDLDGDHRDEILLGAASSTSILGMSWVGPGWSERVHLALGGGAPQDLAAADFDGDGLVDVALAWGPTADDPRMGVTLFYAEAQSGGDASSPLAFGEGVRLYVADHPNAADFSDSEDQDSSLEVPSIAVQAADLDGDGRPELLFDSGIDGAVRLLWNNGEREFAVIELPGRSALILEPGALLTIPAYSITRHKVFGRRIGPAITTSAHAPHRFGAVTDCNNDGAPDLQMKVRSGDNPGSPFLVGVGGDFLDYPEGYSPGFRARCIDADGDELPDLVSLGGRSLQILYTDPG